MRCSAAAVWLLLSAVTAPLHAQTTRLLGRVVDLAGQPVRDVRLHLVGQGDPEVFSSGEFELQLAGRPAQVEVQLVGTTSQQILYPLNGLVAVPADPTVRVTVVVGKTDRAFVNDALAARFVQLSNALRQNGVRDAAVLDSLSASMRQIIGALGLTQDSLRKAIALQSQQAQLKPLLFKTFDAYLLELKDLRDAFRLVVSFAAKDRNALMTLRQAVENYNVAYTALNNNRNAFQDNIRDYWTKTEAEGLSRDLADVYTEAVEEIHKGYVLPLNQSLVVLQNIYGPNKPKADEIRKAIDESDRAVRQLDVRVNVLEERYARLRSALGGS